MSQIFHSILFEAPKDDSKGETLEPPAFFVDLNLDQIIDAVTAAKKEYRLTPFSYTSLNGIDAIKYRQEIFRDIEDTSLLDNIKSFAVKMSTMRRHLALADKLYYQYHKEGWFLEAVETYCEAVTCLLHDLNAAKLKSRGLLDFREYLAAYVNSGGFTSLLAETEKLKADLSTIRYCLLIKDNCVSVRKYESEIDYSVDVEETFAKFKQGAVKDYKAKLPLRSGMNHVEAAILDFVAKLYPDMFLSLNEYSIQNANFMDETIVGFDREVQFYVSYLQYIEKLKLTGLRFCYPQISSADKDVHDYEGFDLALAHKLAAEGSSIICNDFYLKGKERIIVVSGPNQGGKSTFLRSIGLSQLMMQCGMFVPAESFSADLCHGLFTHYKREEDATMESGKLDEELARMSDIVDKIRSNSLVLFNESFAATNAREGSEIARQIVRALLEKRIKVFFVTHFYEFAHSFSDKKMENAIFLRAERRTDGKRTFRLIEGEPLQTSYGEDLYKKIFGPTDKHDQLSEENTSSYEFAFKSVRLGEPLCKEGSPKPSPRNSNTGRNPNFSERNEDSGND